MTESRLWALSGQLNTLALRCSAAAVLEPIRLSDGGRLQARHVDPVFLAAMEVSKKALDKPTELRRSSKLFRACEAIQCALLMPAHKANSLALVGVLSELRSMSGWTEADTWLPPSPRGRARRG